MHKKAASNKTVSNNSIQKFIQTSGILDQEWHNLTGFSDKNIVENRKT